MKGNTIAIFPYGNGLNPYQLLTKEMFEQENEVITLENNSLFPLMRNVAFDYLYLDWLSPYCISENKYKTFLKTSLFLFQIFIVKLFKKKVIWNVHNLHDHEKRSHYIDTFLHKTMFLLSCKIRFFSESARDSFLAYYGVADNNKTVVISHPRYDDFYQNLISEDNEIFNEIDASHMNILFMGNIREYKGINSLLNNIKFHKLDHNLKFIVAGKKSGNFKLLRKSNVTYIVKYIEDKNLKELFEKSAIVILPYTQIMTSGMLYLCMCFQKPVICPVLPFFLEVLGETYPYYYHNMDELCSILNTLDRNVCHEIGLKLREKSILLDYEFLLKEFKNKVFE